MRTRIIKGAHIGQSIEQIQLPLPTIAPIGKGPLINSLLLFLHIIEYLILALAMVLPQHPLPLINLVASCEVVEHLATAVHHVVGPVADVEVFCVFEHEVALAGALAFGGELPYVAAVREVFVLVGVAVLKQLLPVVDMEVTHIFLLELWQTTNSLKY
jgi:hypothetical protein